MRLGLGQGYVWYGSIVLHETSKMWEQPGDEANILWYGAFKLKLTNA